MKNVMIVDDNKLNAEGILKSIDWNHLGATVIAVLHDGLTALEVIKDPSSTNIDLIITDIKMPGLNGLEMSREILKLNPQIKIILVSAFDNFEYAKQAVRIGAYDYIEKPLDYTYLSDMIQNALTAIDKEQHNLKILEQSRPAMIENFFSDLIHTYSDEARYQLTHYRNYLNLNLECHFYIVMLFNIENIVQVKSDLGIQAYHLQLIDLKNTINELGKDFDLMYTLNDLHGLICIFGRNYSHQVTFLKSVNLIASAIHDQYKDKALNVNIGIGNVIKYLWNMHLSYESARHALEYRFFFPQKNIFDARDILRKNLSVDLFTDRKEEELVQLICKKDQAGITAWVDQFSKEVLENYRTKNLLFVRVYSVLGRILKFLYELNIQSSDIEREIMDVYAKIDSVHDSRQIFKWLNHICLLACSKLADSLKSHHEQLCESVVNYIKQNYEKSGLCLNEIAEFVNVSPAHLSAVFKKSSGQNISDLITSFRIDVACQLLLYTSLSLKEISDKVGYTNQYYFSSCFKKKIGKTPSQFRMESKTD